MNRLSVCPHFAHRCSGQMCARSPGVPHAETAHHRWGGGRGSFPCFGRSFHIHRLSGVPSSDAPRRGGSVRIGRCTGRSQRGRHSADPRSVYGRCGSRSGRIRGNSLFDSVSGLSALPLLRLLLAGRHDVQKTPETVKFSFQITDTADAERHPCDLFRTKIKTA